MSESSQEKLASSCREDKSGILLSDQSFTKVEQNVASGVGVIHKHPSTNKKADKNVKSGPTSAAASASHSKLTIAKFPIRVGIEWEKGAKLEAMDYSDTWYPSKIISVDAVDNYVLIHFEGWNQRYDEWFPMNSEKLRPSTRHSERKEKNFKQRRQYPHPVSETPCIFRAGERVLAKWTDCKKYPAKVNRLLEDGSYEVTFYDGITYAIQPINIWPLAKESQPKELQDVPVLQPVQDPEKSNMSKPPKTLLSFKSIKLKLPENVSKKISQKSKLKAKKRFSPIKMGRPKKHLSSGEESWKASQPEGKPLQMKVKRLSTDSESESLSKQGHEVKLSEEKNLTASTAVIRVSPTADIDFTGKTPGTSAATVEEIRPPVLDLGNVPSPRNLKHSGKKKRYRAGTGLDMKKRKRSKYNSVGDLPLPKKRTPSGDHLRAQSLDTGLGIVPPVNLPPGYVYMPFEPPKRFVVETDHNPFKCLVPGCNKEFRKENLLNSHLKHYHSDAEVSSSATASSPSTLSQQGAATSMAAPYSVSTPATSVSDNVASQSAPASFHPLLPPVGSVQSPVLPGVQGRRRRKKTSSILPLNIATGSTDSDLSVSSAKGRSSSKRRRHDSEISVTTASPDIAHRDLWADVKPRVKEEDIIDCQDTATDVEEPDIETEADVVNCVCGLRETGGLMIQCDVCMCWQHFACVDTGDSQEPPVNYVCSICENTPGIRDSCRFIHDMSWERRGELPTFRFTGPDKCNITNRLKTAAGQCNDLMASLHNIKSVLHSTRRQIKISKEEDDPEFQLWQMDWDHWTKPEEELLTPHSVDPVPSPTPSTFLFPPAPPLPTSTNTNFAGVTSSASSLQVSTNTLTTTVGSPMISAHSPLNSAGSSVLSPNTSAPTSIRPNVPELIDSSSLSPPLSGQRPTSHPTPSSLRGSVGTRPSIQGSAGGLVRDLFPGPAGDASSFQASTVFQNGHGSMSPLNEHNSVELESQRRNSEDKDSNMSESNMNSVRHLSTVGTVSSGREGALAGREMAQEAGNSTQETNLEKVSDQNQSNHRVSMNDTSESDKDKETVVNGSTSENIESNHLGINQSSGLATSGGITETVCPGTNTNSSLYMELADDGHLNGFDDDKDDNDVSTDTAEESVDPYKNCERNLLIHVTNVHDDIEKQLEILEQQIIDLENSDHNDLNIQLSEENALNDIPALKKSLGKLSNNLGKIQRLSANH